MTSYPLGQIDGYQICYNQIVGSGSYAQVYDCKNPDINESICVKVLGLDSNHTEMFKREVEVLRKIKEINHINLIKIYHVTEQNNIIYIFMKKYRCNLEQWFTKKRSFKKMLTIQEILNLNFQIINGYKQLYNNKIIHRDLKPANILIGDDGCLKISDFGLGKVIEELEQAGQHSMVGSPIFASPQCLMNGNYSSKTDVYSLGAIIYYLTFGEHIFKTSTLFELIQQINSTLQKQEIKLPNILNEGDQDQIQELIDFFKLTITFSEEIRIDWESLFDWFNLDEQKENYQQILGTLQERSENNKSQVNNQNIPSFQEQQTQQDYKQSHSTSALENEKTVQSGSLGQDAQKKIAYFAESFQQLSQSLVIFMSSQFEQSSISVPEIVKKGKQNNLEEQSKIFQFTQVILAKGKLATTILECLQLILTREVLRYVRQLLKALQVLMAGYHNSIMLLGNCIHSGQQFLKSTTIGKEMINEFPETMIAAYISSQSLIVQKQIKQLRSSFDSATHQIKNFLDNFHNNVEESYSYPSIKIQQLFSAPELYLDHKGLAIQYQADFNQLLGSMTTWLIVDKNDYIFLKQSEYIFRFIACSFKFINNECKNQQLINNYMHLDLDYISLINDDIDELIQIVQQNAPYLQIK